MTDFSRLSKSWITWSTVAGIPGATVSTECDDCEVAFLSDDDSVHLRHEADWWKIDVVNDRGQRYEDVASLSNYGLVEKFLIWRWASLARTTIGAKQLGAELHAKGLCSAVEFVRTQREYVVELRHGNDRAVVSEASAVVFSHVMTMSVEEIENLVSQDIS
ncbi:hypothetical protein [Mycobacterium paraterrae]|uniref:Uncharacterized protein n=1 Tax=Mycobacterium paraterrae TaxID=577492 RepID=A0ABY3VKI0_9MYCO|nr:hypothetical protein [Mycobacterium paraterrae]UMB69146.1 hypothetical protein MKK62_22705 [Mycobacterium paraterrae]